MSVQRWVFPLDTPRTWAPEHDSRIKYVTYADHVAAVAEAEQRVRQAQRDLCFGTGGQTGQHEWLEAKGYAEGWEKGGMAALDAAREAVAALSKPDFHWANATDGQCGIQVGYEHALAAIDALRGGS